MSKPKLKLHIDKWSSVDGLYISINDKAYHFKDIVSTQLVDELQFDIDKGVNRGRLIKKLERFGKGEKLTDIDKLVQIIANTMEAN